MAQDKKFVSLRSLLIKKSRHYQNSTHSIARAVEEYGCYALDKLSRPTHGNLISGNQEEIRQEALEALAKAYELDRYGTGNEYDQFIEFDKRIERLGWPEDKLPNFDQLAIAKQAKKGGPNVTTATKLLEGMLLLANKDVDWLFREAGFENLQAHGEVQRLQAKLKSVGKTVPRGSLVVALDALGVRPMKKR